MTTLATSNLNAGAYVPEERYAGETDIITKPALLLANEGALPERTVLGRVTASGKLRRCVLTAVDGSQVPVAILVDAVTVGASDLTAAVYIAGEFNVALVNFHSTFDTEAKRLDAFGTNGPIVLRKLGYSGG